MILISFSQEWPVTGDWTKPSDRSLIRSHGRVAQAALHPSSCFILLVAIVIAGTLPPMAVDKEKTFLYRVF